MARERVRIAELETALADATSPGQDKSLGARERESLLKLLIGMAIEQYGFDPIARRSSATANIASDLARHGVALDEDTVRKWLREAVDFLPRETE